GNATIQLILGVLLVKSVMWGVSLGSGTSGGVLAPLLMMGSALGALEALFLPHQGAGFWPLISMGAMLAGTMRSPLTGVIFSFELTNDYHSILPLLIACMGAHAFTVLTLSRSILTEKISRRGHHLTREYVVDPLEVMAVEDVMRTNITAFPAAATLADLDKLMIHEENGQRLYPVVDDERRLVGTITRAAIREFVASLTRRELSQVPLENLVTPSPEVAFPDEPLRFVVNRMATTGFTLLPVVERGPGAAVLGIIGLKDLLKAREFSLEEEHRRERVLRLRLPPSLRRKETVLSR